MRRPSFQFYPGDWQSNANLRRCTHEEKGIWMDVMCLLHDSEEYGVLRWSLSEIARAVGTTKSKIRKLIEKNILKGDEIFLKEPFIFTPRSGRKNGAPVELISPQNGPVWYSSRMVVDEHKRKNSGASTRFCANKSEVEEQQIDNTTNNTKPGINAPPSHSPCRRHGENESDGSSSSSSSSSSIKNNMSDLQSDFGRVWDCFPVDLGAKGSKKNAFTEFRKLKPDKALISEMILAAKAQAAEKYSKRRAGQFAENFPHLERWIKHRRWEDEIQQLTAVSSEVNWV